MKNGQAPPARTGRNGCPTWKLGFSPEESDMPRSGAIKLASLAKRNAGFIEPMECALVANLPEGSQWTYEVKLDGYRVIAARAGGQPSVKAGSGASAKAGSEAILYSRNGRNFNKRYPHIAEALRALPADTVVDGEVVALD